MLEEEEDLGRKGGRRMASTMARMTTNLHAIRSPRLRRVSYKVIQLASRLG